jgi:hypothetical protein
MPLLDSDLRLFRGGSEIQAIGGGAFLDFVLGEHLRVGDEELRPDKLGSPIALKYKSVYDATEQRSERSATRSV